MLEQKTMMLMMLLLVLKHLLVPVEPYSISVLMKLKMMSTMMMKMRMAQKM